MARSVNTVTLIGNVGSDPEVRSTTNGSRVATLSLATSRQWTDASGTRQEKTEWHRLVVWNRGKGTLADIVERYVKKGDKLYVTGSIEYRQWQDKEGQTRYSTEINVDEVVMLGSPKGDGGSRDGDRDERRTRDVRGTVNRTAASKAAPSEDFEEFPGALEDEDDDLPF